jgi:hypothetical protein
VKLRIKLLTSKNRRIPVTVFIFALQAALISENVVVC